MVNKSRQVLAVEREAEDMVKQICFSWVEVRECCCMHVDLL
jgi:hypothetical protein